MSFRRGRQLCLVLSCLALSSPKCNWCNIWKVDWIMVSFWTLATSNLNFHVASITNATALPAATCCSVGCHAHISAPAPAPSQKTSCKKRAISIEVQCKVNFRSRCESCHSVVPQNVTISRQRYWQLNDSSPKKKRRKRKKKKQQKKGGRKPKRNRNRRGNTETRFQGFTTAANTLRLQWPINLANSAQFNNNLLNKFTCHNIVRVRVRVSRRDPIVHTHFNINDLSPNKWTRRPPANCMVYYAFGQQVTVGVAFRLHCRGRGGGVWGPAWSVSSVQVFGWEPPHAGFA